MHIISMHQEYNWVIFTSYNFSRDELVTGIVFTSLHSCKNTGALYKNQLSDNGS